MVYERELFEGIRLEQGRIRDTVFIDCHFQDCKVYDTELLPCSIKNCTFENCVIYNGRFQFTDAADNGFQQCSVVGMAWNEVERSDGILLPFSAFKKFTSFLRQSPF